MKYLEHIEKAVVLSLMVIMVSIVFHSTFELGYIIAKGIIILALSAEHYLLALKRLKQCV